MGIRQRVVKQTVVELVCDLCKQVVPESEAKTGTLSLRSKGQRGRSTEARVAFHSSCASKIIDSARGGKSSAKRRGRPAGTTPKGGRKAAPKAAKRPTAKRPTAKRAAAKGPTAKRPTAKRAAAERKSQ